MALSVYYNPESLFLLILEGIESLTFEGNFTKVYEMITFYHFRIITGLVPYGPEPVLHFLQLSGFTKHSEIVNKNASILVILIVMVCNVFNLGKIFPLGGNVIFNFIPKRVRLFRDF